MTRDRLYLETVEQVMANSSKVLVDLQSGNNIMFLPLDKLLSGQGAGSVLRPGDPNRDDGGASAADMDDARRARDALRTRMR